MAFELLCVNLQIFSGFGFGIYFVSMFKIDKPKIVSQSQSQKLRTLFSLKSHCPLTNHLPPQPPARKVSKRQDRAILPKKSS